MKNDLVIPLSRGRRKGSKRNKEKKLKRSKKTYKILLSKLGYSGPDQTRRTRKGRR